MRLTVVGCAGSYPNAASPASCYLLEHDGHRLILDLGNGSLGALHNYLDPTESGSMEAVVVSHCHIDHCADLASLFVARHHYATERLPRLPVHGPSDMASRLAAIYGAHNPTMMQSSFDFRTHEQAPVDIGPFTIQTVVARHPVEAYSIRVSAGGCSVTYSGDTGPNPDLAVLAGGTDVALFEASFVGTGNPRDLHMSGADAARSAAAADAGLLMLTHFVTRNDEERVLSEAAEEFSGPIELAKAGMSITL